MYRPDNWVEVSNRAVVELKERGIDFNPACFSAGADAMYEPAYERGRKDEQEALKKKAIHIRKAREGWADITISFGEIATDMGIINKAGYLVFIEEEENAKENTQA